MIYQRKWKWLKIKGIDCWITVAVPQYSAASCSLHFRHSHTFNSVFFHFPKISPIFYESSPKIFRTKKNLFLSHQVPLISNPYDFSVFSSISFHRFCSSFMLTSCVLCNTFHFNWHHFRIPLSAKFFPFFYAFFLAKHYFTSQLNWK